MPRNMGMSQWLQLPEIARLFGLSEDSIKRLAKNHGLPLRRVSPFAMPGTLESELSEWLKAQHWWGRPCANVVSFENDIIERRILLRDCSACFPQQ
jgi:hypothetical protein